MYKYLHVNGQVIEKVDFVVNSLLTGPYSYFDSDFVRAWWHVDEKTGLIDQSFPKARVGVTTEKEYIEDIKHEGYKNTR